MDTRGVTAFRAVQGISLLFKQQDGGEGIRGKKIGLNRS